MLKPSDRRDAFKIVAIYALAAAAWIALSDYATNALIGDRALLLTVDTFKGVAFIIVSAFLTYKALRGQLRHRAEAMAAVRELTRAHRLSAAVNAAVIRARSRQELFEAVTEVAVTEGGYAMSCVGQAQDDPEKSVRVAARAGRDDGYLDAGHFTWDDSPRGRGPFGRAIKTGRIQVGHFRADAHLEPWRADAAKRGFASVICVPLLTGGRTVGIFTLYSRTQDVFDPAETDLLEKMAYTLGFALDKLAHEEAERTLGRANRMISACDRAMIRAGSREELFAAVTRVAVEEGGYLLSWVGLAQDDAAKTVLPAARAGHDDGYVDSVRVVWSDTERGRGPTGAAVRTGDVQICPRMDQDPVMAPWQDALGRHGFVSSVALPLKAAGRTVGALTMYTDRADRFDLAEVTLLEKMTASISYALGNLARQEKERAQVDQLRKLSHAVENSPSSIVITDVAGRIEYVNAKFTAISGYTAAEVLGKNPRVLKFGDTPAEEYKKLWATISSGREWHGEFHNRSKFGAEFWEQASISPIKDEDGRISNYIAVNKDITNERLLELQLRQAQKMEAIGTLAGGVSHDFNNILTVIQGHCSLLETAKLPTADQRDSVAEIQQSADRAAALTRQLLAFGRRQPLNLKRVDVGENAGRMCRMLRRLVPESVTLEASAPREPLVARADTAMVDQVLMNLVLNARDAVGGRGTIRIEVAAADDAVSYAEGRVSPNGWVRLSVNDDGAGIPTEVLPRVFEPFFTTKPKGKGSGLGLAVVDGIVRQHKGWVAVDSAVGKGSSFSVFLPREAPAGSDAAAPQQGPVPRGAETLLLAEDEPSLRKLCVRGQETLGYRVQAAPNGDAAADLWARRDGPVPLLITDMVMPGSLSGELLARRLRQDDPGLRVVFISGYNPDSEGIQAAFPPRTVFLQKPFHADDLARTVRSLLDEP